MYTYIYIYMNKGAMGRTFPKLMERQGCALQKAWKLRVALGKATAPLHDPLTRQGSAIRKVVMEVCVFPSEGPRRA